MKTILLAACAAFALAAPASAQDYNLQLQAQQQQMQLQQQMDRLADQQREHQQHIYNQSLQMRAGGSWYNHSQPYC